MSCFIDFIDINLWEKYTLTNLVSRFAVGAFHKMPDISQVSSHQLTGAVTPASDRILDRFDVAVGIFVEKNKAPCEVGIEPTNDGYEPPAITILAIRSLLLVPF